MQSALFLRAERLADGTRTFRIVDGEPLQTSYGEDLYGLVFGTEPQSDDKTGAQPASAFSGTGYRS